MRSFLGLSLKARIPDHSSLSRIRGRISLDVHEEVFGWVLKVLAKEGLLKGKTVGVDATTLEANAALKSIVRRDTGEGYEAYLEKLAKASGIKTPTRKDLEKMDRKRKGKGSNKDWKNPHDPDAKITKMKDGRTHLSHKDEHAVDMDTGAILGITIHPANRGDCQSIEDTLANAQSHLHDVAWDLDVRLALPRDQRPRKRIEEVVTDKGYHSNESLVRLEIEG